MRRVAGLLAVAALAVVAAGCGGKTHGSTSQALTGRNGTVAQTPSTQAGGTTKRLRVGLVTDIGGLNDRSFNHLAYVGLQRAEQQLGVEGHVSTSTSAADYIPNLSTLAQEKYDLVIGVGFLMADAIATVAEKFPQTDFAIVDYPAAALKGKPRNVQGLVFREQEAGYLAGYLAGLVEKKRGDAIGAVGGQKIPPVDHYIAGFQFGARRADPGVKVLVGYSQDFVDQAKCKELALNQIARGSDVEFQVAGGCGLGVLDAARQKSAWGIGVDADQSYLGPQILTSAEKKVDVAVFTAIRKARTGRFSGGDLVFDAKNGGVGIGKISPKVPAAIVTKVRAQERLLRAGKITGIPEAPT